MDGVGLEKPEDASNNDVSKHVRMSTENSGGIPTGTGAPPTPPTSDPAALPSRASTEVPTKSTTTCMSSEKLHTTGDASSNIAPAVKRIGGNSKETDVGGHTTSATQQSASNDLNSGNDQVPVDKLHEPLVPTENTFSPPKTAAKNSSPTATVAPTNKSPIAKGNPSQIAKPEMGKVDSSPPNTKPSTSPSSYSKPLEVPSSPPDEQTLLEEAIRKERAPLVDTYAPFIIPSDTTLEDARSRLRIAIEQTRQLRAAFTERVYGKYRVCLIPPSTTEEILTRILTDPRTAHTELQAQIKEAKAEKEIEKKEAQKLNAEMAAANNTGNAEGSNTPNPLSAVNAENAEQLMYISAGLSAIILPEQDVVKDNIDTSSYPDRAPINPQTGQRVRSISAAAAAAGEVMLDRARKGAAMRAERHRRKQLQISSGKDTLSDADNNYSRLLILSNSPAPPVAAQSKPKPAPPVKTQQPAAPPLKPPVKPTLPAGAATTKALLAAKPFKKPAPPKPAAPSSPSPASAKAIRARVQASMSLNMLLSLNPSTEDLDGKPSASTKAMIERGVAPHTASSKSNQQRYRHPFPESPAGRQGALASGQVKKDSNQQEPLPHPSYNSLALPALLTARERRSCKGISFLDREVATSIRAKKAIRCVLDQFNIRNDEAGNEMSKSALRPRKRKITEISFLHGVRCSNEYGLDQGTENLPHSKKQEIDPILAFNVLQAVGLVKHVPHGEELENKEFAKEFDTTLFDNAEKGAMSGEDGGQTRRAISKLRTLCKKFVSNKRLFSDAFNEKSALRPETSESTCEEGPETTSKLSTQGTSKLAPNNSETISGNRDDFGDMKLNDAIPSNAPPVVSIRGGGEIIMGSNDGGGNRSQSQGSGQQPKNGSDISSGTAEARREQSSQETLHHQRGTIPMNLPTNHLAQQGNAVRAGMVWEDPSRQSLALMNPRLVDQGYPLGPGVHQSIVGQHANGTSNAARNTRMQGQMPSADQFHHHSTANALQLAQHLRHATSSMTRLPQHGLHGGDLADYIGGLHPQPSAGYDWSTIGAASHSQLAALGIHPHRAAIMNFSVQDRTRALIVREQQNAAAAAAHAAHTAHRQSLSSQQAVNFLGGPANHGYPPAGSPHFPRIAGPAAALLNSPAALMGHHGMSQVPAPTQVQPASRMQTQKDQRVNQQKAEQSTKKEPKLTKEGRPEQVSLPRTEQPHCQEAAKETDRPQSKKEPPQSVVGSKRDTTTMGKDEKAPPGKKSKLVEVNRKPGKEEKEPRRIEPISMVAGNPEGCPLVKPDNQEASAAENFDKNSREKPISPSDGKGNEHSSHEVKPPKTQTKPAPKTQTKPAPKTLIKAASMEKKQEGDVSVAHSGGRNETGKTSSEGTTQRETKKTDVPAEVANGSEETSNDIHIESNSEKPGSLQSSGGLQFFVPPAPLVLPAEAASLVLAAQSHEAIDLLDNAGATCDASVLVNYLVAVGSAVPIPKALVAQPLKEKLAGIVVKNAPIGTFPVMSREAIAASILLWLWRHHEDCFQRAFAKNGRIDVDHGCKWLVQTAVDKAVSSLSREISDPASRSGSLLTSSLLTLKTKGAASNKCVQGVEMERLSLTSTKLDLLTISIVSRGLMLGISIDDSMNSLIPHFDDLLCYLDDCRKYVLYSKSQERVFLANLISRKATMSLPFSHAYVSSMVRAGEAVGHGELFEIVQNEDVNVSTNIPYDVFTDESGAWEDPCRPPEGYSQGLTGDDLMRRAHARAMIQKSLKKLQDRHNIRGGTHHPGPYVDPPSSGSGNASDSSKAYSASGTSTTPRGWVKRRSSFSEPPVQAGTGSAPATSWALYDPKHYSAPLVWKSDDAENSPYGSHNKNKRSRSLSILQGVAKSGGKNIRGKSSGRSMSVSSVEQVKQDKEEGMRQSTREIAWSDVASVFENVKLPGSASAQKEKEANAALRQKTIFAPFVRQVELTFDDIDSESDDDEDLRDEIVLERHQVVLDRMKEKLSAVFEALKKTQDRRKSRDRVK